MSSSRPLHGESIYLQSFKRVNEKDPLFSSPPRGIYISTQKLSSIKECQERVLVPSTGNLYIYKVGDLLDDVIQFSSPPRGIYISTLYRKKPLASSRLGSRPLHGESIYLQAVNNPRIQTVKRSRPLHGESIYLRDFDVYEASNGIVVLVPSTGNLYIYRQLHQFEIIDGNVLVPSTGNLYIYPSPCYPARILGSLSSLRCKPANQIIFIIILLSTGQFH